MRRISVVLAVLALLVVMVGSAVPAMADQGNGNDWGSQGSNGWDNQGSNYGGTHLAVGTGATGTAGPNGAGALGTDGTRNSINLALMKRGWGYSALPPFYALEPFQMDGKGPVLSAQVLRQGSPIPTPVLSTLKNTCR